MLSIYKAASPISSMKEKKEEMNFIIGLTIRAHFH